MRPDHDGLPWPKGLKGPAARQRNPEGADPFSDTRARAPVSVREAHEVPCFPNPVAEAYVCGTGAEISQGGAGALITEVLE